MHADKAVSATPSRIKKRVGARISKTCVFFSTLALFKRTRTLHILEVCVCFYHVRSVMYAYKAVSTTPSRIKKRVGARNSKTCVFLTLALFKTTRTLHILEVCVCFSDVNFLVYA